MQIVLKLMFLIITTSMAISTIVLAVAEPQDEMRSLVITADYHSVNVNKASTSLIAAGMKGVGLKTATAIVAYRRANWPFNSLDALTDVKGVGPRTLQKNESVNVLE